MRDISDAGQRVRPTGILRILTCGSVDDGKSTLLGRLMLDTGSIPSDQWAVLSGGATAADLAHVFDGLAAEREQGITIDVSYRFFRVGRRRFRLLDSPGHEQFTRNMATAASGADLAVVLVDVEKGLLIQSRRHIAICDLFGVRRFILAVNKMDRIGFDEARFEEVVATCRDFARGFASSSFDYLPISALHGDNVARRSERTPWWAGKPLLAHLEDLDLDDRVNDRPFRLPIQLVDREGSGRRYAGTIASGTLTVDDEVTISPSGQRTRVKGLLAPDGPRALATAGEAVMVELADHLDVGRGDILSPVGSRPSVGTTFAARLICLSERGLIPGRSYDLGLGTALTKCAITVVQHRLDPGTLAEASATELAQNEIGLCHLATTTQVAFDAFALHPKTGAFILIDRTDYATVGAGVILHEVRPSTHERRQAQIIDKEARIARNGHRPIILWFTGLSGAGKSTVASLVEELLWSLGCHTALLDGDNIRDGLSADLGFTDPDRVENIRRAGHVARLMLEAGLIVICSFISPHRSERRTVRALVADGEFLEIFVDTPIEECMRRDPKGLYAKALAGEIPNFTGVSSVYEVPDEPEMRLATTEHAADELAGFIIAELAARGIIKAGVT